MNNLTVTEPTVLITDKELKEIVKHSVYSSDREVSYFRLNAIGVYLHAEMSEYEKDLVHCELWIKEIQVSLSKEQNEFVRGSLLNLYNDIL